MTTPDTPKTLKTAKPFYYVYLPMDRRVIETLSDGKRVGRTLLPHELLTPYQVRYLEPAVIDSCMTLLINLLPVDHLILFGVRKLTTCGKAKLAALTDSASNTGAS